MEVKKFIEEKLHGLATKNPGLSKPNSEKEMVELVVSKLMSKKFRKYSVSEEYSKYISESVSESTSKKEPIRLAFPFGGYKLWRFSESPEADWAELFTLIHYTRWLKDICQIYGPGVELDFVSDDVILEKMNNIPKEDTEKYKNSFLGLIAFIKKYSPKNLIFKYTQVGSFYTKEEFEADLEDKIQKTRNLVGGLPQLDDHKVAMIEMNVRLKPEQGKDEHWREKVELIHQAYYTIDKRRPYSRAKGKILVFPYAMKDGKCIAVGTTKTSVAKFWVGIGVLKRGSGGFVEYVFSPKQIERQIFITEEVSISGLAGKNFQNIKIFE